MSQQRIRRFGLGFLATCTMFSLARDASAEPMLIEHPGDHPSYNVELEPHVNLGYGLLDTGYIGAGFRASIKILDPGPIKTINDTFAITFGGDVLSAKNGRPYFWVPVAVQWNFFFTKSWSAFGEGGVVLGLQDQVKTRFQPVVGVGGRYHINERFALTLRLGYPTVSFGLSIFL